MIYQLREGPLDGQELEVLDTAFEATAPGKVGIKVRQPRVHLVSDDADPDAEVPAREGFYETTSPRMEASVGVLTWGGWR